MLHCHPKENAALQKNRFMAPEDVKFGKIALELGFIQPEQLRQCVVMQKEQSCQGKKTPFSQLMLQLRYLNLSQISIVQNKAKLINQNTEEFVDPELKTRAYTKSVIHPEAKTEVYIENEATEVYSGTITNCYKDNWITNSDDLITNADSNLITNADSNLITNIDSNCVTETYKTPKTNAPQKTCLDRYQILHILGKGGMGTVYKAKDPLLDRIVALKLMNSKNPSQQCQKRFLREAKSIAKLHHPHIVKFYDINYAQEQLFFTMEFIEGASLKEFLKKEIDFIQTLQIIIKIARGVAYAHSQGCIHRDLKPGNIMINKDNNPIIMDFGIVKLQQKHSNISTTGSILGTLQYMPPEQTEGSREIDERSDIYSLGIILYEMLTKKLPFYSNSKIELVRKILDEEAIAPKTINPSIPNQLSNICLKAMAKKKENRYQNATQLMEALKAISFKEKTGTGILKSKRRPKNISDEQMRSLGKTCKRISRNQMQSLSSTVKRIPKIKQRNNSFVTTLLIVLLLPFPILFFFAKSDKSKKKKVYKSKSKKRETSIKTSSKKTLDYYHKVLIDKPRCYWRLGDLSGSMATNLVNANLFGIYKNGVLLGENSKIATNPAAYFDGYDDFITVASAKKMFVKKSFSIELWAKYYSFAKRGSLVGITKKGWFLGNKGNRFCFAASRRKLLTFAQGTIALRKWSYLVATYDGTRIKLYVDGKLTANSIRKSKWSYDKNASLDIGLYRNKGSFNAHHGLIDDVAIYDYVLSQKQIQEHFASVSKKSVNKKKILALEAKVQQHLTGYSFHRIRYYNGNYYLYITTPVFWEQAQNLCQKLGGNLLSIHSEDENNFVCHSLGIKQGSWLGLCRDTEGEFYWTTEEPFAYKKWQIKQPFGTPDFPYTVISPYGPWDNLPKQVPFPFVCKWSEKHSTQLPQAEQSKISSMRLFLKRKLYDNKDEFYEFHKHKKYLHFFFVIPELPHQAFFNLIHKTNLSVETDLSIKVNDFKIENRIKNQIYNSEYFDITRHLKPGKNNIRIYPKKMEDYSAIKASIWAK